MTTYRAQVSRDGRYWLVYLPDIDKYTQARNLAEVESMATDLVALWLEVPSDSVAIHVEVELPTDVHHHLELAQKYRDEASWAQAEAAREYRSAAAVLKSQGMTMRDIGQVLGVSHQRAQQLVEG